MKKKSEIKLKVAGLVYNQSIAGTYGLVLEEEVGTRRFSVMIGEPEAQSIALKMNQRKSARPLTHDLILTILSVFNAKIEKVLIYQMINDVFFSELHLRKSDTSMIVDSRTSDAIALAVRSGCDICIKEDVMDIVGMDTATLITDESETNAADLNAEDLTENELVLLTVEDLEELLNLAVKQEKYELAVNLRDAIKKKKNA